MKKGSKFFAILISLMLVFICIPVQSFGEDYNDDYDNDDLEVSIAGTNIITYDDNGKAHVSSNLPQGMSFNIDKQILTLDNCTIDAGGKNCDYIYSNGYLDIELKGTNTFTGASCANGICATELYFYGGGSLKVDVSNGSYVTGIYSDSIIDIQNCTLDIIGGNSNRGYFYGMSLNAWGNYADGNEEAYIKIKDSTVNISNSTPNPNALNLGMDCQDADMQIENSIVNIFQTGGSCWGIGSGLYDEYDNRGYFGGKLSIDANSWVSIQLKDPGKTALDNDSIYAIYYYTDDIQSKNIYAGDYGGAARISEKTVLQKHTWIDERSECTNTLLIFSPFSIQLNASSFDWTGSEIKPAVTVTDNNGNIISADKYSVAYKNNINAGAGYVDVTMKGAYSGTMSALFVINKKADDPANKPADNITDNSAKIVDGSTYTVSGNKVKVLSAASGSASLIQAKNAKSVNVPATVNIEGKTFKITQVNANAFKGSKIQKITIGKNVKVIRKNAFKGSKATTLILKTKLLKKAKVKGSLKGSKIKTIQVKVSSRKSENKKYVKTYNKIFTKSNAGKKVTLK